MAHTDHSNEPWHRNPWVWLLIAIPSMTVLGCALTLYLAISNPHVLTSDAPAEYGPPAGRIDNGEP
jgi:hypothetical protein